LSRELVGERRLLFALVGFLRSFFLASFAVIVERVSVVL